MNLFELIGMITTAWTVSVGVTHLVKNYHGDGSPQYINWCSDCGRNADKPYHEGWNGFLLTKPWLVTLLLAPSSASTLINFNKVLAIFKYYLFFLKRNFCFWEKQKKEKCKSFKRSEILLERFITPCLK